MKREPLSKRYEKLLAIARLMAKEYTMLCSVMISEYGCEGCPLNSEDIEGGGCHWYNDMYVPMSEMGVLDDADV